MFSSSSSSTAGIPASVISEEIQKRVAEAARELARLKNGPSNEKEDAGLVGTRILSALGDYESARFDKSSHREPFSATHNDTQTSLRAQNTSLSKSNSSNSTPNARVTIYASNTSSPKFVASSIPPPQAMTETKSIASFSKPSGNENAHMLTNSPSPFDNGDEAESTSLQFEEVSIGDFTIQVAPLPNSLKKKLSKVDTSIERALKIKEESFRRQMQSMIGESPSKLLRPPTAQEDLDQVALHEVAQFSGTTTTALNSVPNSQFVAINPSSSSSSSSAFKVLGDGAQRFPTASSKRQKTSSSTTRKRIITKEAVDTISTATSSTVGSMPSSIHKIPARARQKHRTEHKKLTPEGYEISDSDLLRVTRQVGNACKQMETILFPQFGTVDRMPPTPSLAASYWTAVSTHLSSTDEEIAHLDDLKLALQRFTEKSFSHSDLMHTVGWILAGADDKLILGFDMFLPPQFSMASLLAFQKQCLALACYFDKSLVGDYERQREIIRKGMVDLVEAFEQNPITQKSLKQQPPLVEVVSSGSMTLMPTKPDVAQEKITKSTMTQLGQATVQWIDEFLQRYEKDERRCITVLRAFADLGKLEMDTKYLANIVRECVQDDEVLKKSFDALALSLFT